MAFGRITVALLGLWAGAGRAEPATELPPVVVPLPEAEPPPAAPQARDPSGATSSVDAQELAGQAQDTAGALVGVPGLCVQDSGGFGQAKTVSVRGAAGNGVLVLLDGVPLNAGGGTVDLSRIPFAALDKLELLRGGAGARYGSGGLGGVLYLSTRQPEEGGRAFAEAMGGSFSTFAGHLGATGALLGGQALVLVHGARSEGDFTYLYDEQPAYDGNPLAPRERANNQSQAGGALLKLRRAFGERWVADGMAELVSDARGLAGTVDNPTPDAREDALRLMGALHASRAGDLRLEADVTFHRDEVRLLGGSFGAGTQQRESSAGVEATASGLAFGWHGLSVTASAAYDWLTAGPPESGVATQVVGRPRLAVMVGDEVLLWSGDVSLLPSVRVDQSGPFTGLSPKLGATWRLPYGLEARANAGQAHRAPSFLELYVQQGHLLPNGALRPERALYADAALSHRTARSQLSLGGFYSLYEDLITYEYYPPFLSRPYNFAAARVAGIELEGQLKPFDGLSAQASYTYLRSQNLKDDPRYYLRELPYRPRHKLFARLSAGPEWLRAHVEATWQSQQFVNRTETLTLPSRTLVAAGATGRAVRSPAVLLSVEVKNLLDVQGADLDGYPLPPRAVYATASISYDVLPSQRGNRP